MEFKWIDMTDKICTIIVIQVKGHNDKRMQIKIHQLRKGLHWEQWTSTPPTSM